MIKKDLTILVTCYNQENEIIETLKSLLNQKTKYKYEIIVSDDLSTDNSFEVLRKFALAYDFINIIQVEEKKGPGNNRNNLISHVKTKYCCFVDGDDKQEELYVEKICDAINKNKAQIYKFKNIKYILDDKVKLKDGAEYISVWSFVYRLDFFSGKKYDDGFIPGEDDILFACRYYSELFNNYATIDYHYVYIRTSKNYSLTNNVGYKKRYNDTLAIIDRVCSYETQNKVDSVNIYINKVKLALIIFGCLAKIKPHNMKINVYGFSMSEKILYYFYKIFGYRVTYLLLKLMRGKS